ncbi:hypothetical protein ICM_06222 [Bacillus cereus BAG1X2-3]|nr:insecticidal delta-endotoxin Cry8Ea1 family protein [Bacillus cereus]EOO22999.1 hypothetical protein ICC_06369 [Bacillus cereus BAG1X1-1]EOO55921.1 hypothetical protein ICM_06222 [Bacillus cereus BAG1X2-3]EOO99861.1 hypothetical protein ICO_06633 [Bacillus cereus BAG2O-1]HDR4539434.1 pesticidal protein [Bacillus cereus]
MNQNNQNEMQIIDSSSNDFSQSNRYPRYPLAKESNYKDWLASCDESNIDTLSTTSDAQNAVLTSLNIASAILSFFTSGIIGTGFGIFNTILGWLWPSNNNAIWEALIRSIEALIDRQIREYERVTALSALQGLRINLAQYNTAFNNWNTNEETRNNPALQREVISRFNIADGFFGNSMPSFRKENYEIQALSVYAQAANLHLLLLRNAVIYGIRWGMDSRTVESHYERMVCLSGAYADHCTFFYRQGLVELRSRGNWNEFNNYRRNMTINVLDIISLFSNYDPRVYSLNTNTQLTREIYTEPLATPLWHNLRLNPTEFQQIENDFIGQPSLSTTLTRFDIGVNRLATGVGGQSYTISRTRTAHHSIGRSVFFTTTWQGATQINPIEQRSLDFDNFNVFNINSQISSGDRFNQNELALGTRQALFHMVNDAGSLVTTREINLPQPVNPRSITSNIAGTNSATPTASDYTHKLSFIKSTRVRGLVSAANIIAYGWTHISLERRNSLLPNRITQIPAIKSHLLSTVANPPGTQQTHIISGPGHNGGGLVVMGSGNSRFQMRIHSSARQRYRVRLRYVNLSQTSCQARIPELGVNVSFTLPGGGGFFNPDLRYSAFQYITLPLEFETPNVESSWVFELGTTNAVSCVIDRVEFMPFNATALEYEGKQNLVKAKKAVEDLFTTTGKEALKIDTTDNDVDQAANLVECVSEEIYAKEKMILLDEVKHAKRFSQSRNLIQNGDFEFATDGWVTSSNVIVQADNTIFKGKYLNMPGAIKTDTTTFPTYIFQKIDESKLKPYTRYKARGFVGSSNEVELIVARYDEEVDAIMNVRNNAPGVPSPFCGECDRCHPQVYPITHDGCHDDRKEQYADVGSHSCHGKPREKHGICHDSHQFDFHIDTGKVYLTENPGIWVLFKISSPKGYATLDNIELIEEGPLVGESLALVKKREQKWKNEMESKWLQTKEAYEKAKREVDGLFTDSQDKALKFETIISNIISAEHLVQSMPYVYNNWLSDVPGMNYDIYTELGRRITQAYSLYERRNIIKNGDFDHDLNHWHATPHAKVQQMDGTAVLVIPNWSSNVSQNLCVEHNHGYVLRVTAKKEDPGKGYVTISDCNGNQETLTFTSCDNYVSNEITNDQSEYPFSQEMNEQRSYNPNETINEHLDYNLGQVRNEQRCYTRNTITNDQSEYPFSQEMNEQRSYNPNETINEQRNYVTRTIDFFPDTDQVRIDIGETEGTFKVESIELICMKSQ